MRDYKLKISILTDPVPNCPPDERNHLFINFKMNRDKPTKAKEYIRKNLKNLHTSDYRTFMLSKIRLYIHSIILSDGKIEDEENYIP